MKQRIAVTRTFMVREKCGYYECEDEDSGEKLMVRNLGLKLSCPEIASKIKMLTQKDYINGLKRATRIEKKRYEEEKGGKK